MIRWSILSPKSPFFGKRKRPQRRVSSNKYTWNGMNEAQTNIINGRGREPELSGAWLDFAAVLIWEVQFLGCKNISLIHPWCASVIWMPALKWYPRSNISSSETSRRIGAQKDICSNASIPRFSRPCWNLGAQNHWSKAFHKSVHTNPSTGNCRWMVSILTRWGSSHVWTLKNESIGDHHSRLGGENPMKTCKVFSWLPQPGRETLINKPDRQEFHQSFLPRTCSSGMETLGTRQKIWPVGCNGERIKERKTPPWASNMVTSPVALDCCDLWNQ